MRLGFLCRAGPPDDRLWLRKIRSWEIFFFSKRNKGILPLVNVVTLCEYDKSRANDRGKVLTEKQLLLSGKQYILRINSKSRGLGVRLIDGGLTNRGPQVC